MFGLFKKKDWRAVINSDKEVVVKAGQNLLAAGLESGLDWPHDCRVGSCGTCRCTLKKGKIKPLNDFSYVLTPDELNQGMILACQSALKSDVEIEVELGDRGEAEIVHLEGVLSATRYLTHDIMEITVSCSKPVPVTTLPGQYMEISYPNLSKPRNYSFATVPGSEEDNQLSFYVRHVPGGEFTDWLFQEDRLQTPMKLSGPFGNFWLRDSHATMLCIAGGSGMSALKSILEHACDIQAERDAVYVFGVRTEKDLYCLDEMEQVRRRWNGDYTFKFIPVLSQEPESSAWKGARGHVTDYFREHYIAAEKLDVTRCQSYMCGPPPMIDAAVEMLTAEGLVNENIFYDKFLDASTIPGGR